MNRPITIAAVITLAAIGCKSDTDGIAGVLVVSSVEVSPGTAQVPLGGSLQLSAVPKTSTGIPVPGRTVVWASDASALVQVSENGMVEGRELGGPVRITATVDGVSGEAQVTSTGEGFKLALVTQPPGSSASGAVLSRAPVIELRNASNGPYRKPGISVTVSLGGGQGTLSGTRTVATNSDGRATFQGLSITGTVGSYTLTFNAPQFGPATSSAITLTPGPAVRLAMATQPSPSAESGEKFVIQPVVQLLDASGNAVPQSGVTVTAAIQSGLGFLGGDRTKSTSGSGSATFGDLKITGLGNHTIVFTAPGLTSVVSATISVTP